MNSQEGGCGTWSKPGSEVTWLGKGRGRNCFSLGLTVWTRKEVEEQAEERRAGVASLPHCSQHLLLGHWVTMISLCLACVCVEKSELHGWVNSISLTTLSALRLLSLLSTSFSLLLSHSIMHVCVLMWGVITSAMIILFLLSITANTVNTGQFCPWPRPF